MTSIKDCETRLLEKGFSQDKINEIKNYLYSMSKEIIKYNLKKYE